MTADEAVALAVKDAQHVVELAQHAQVTADGSELLVDGSAYSPSWRVLAGGSAVYEAVPRSPFHEDLIEAYEGTLDERIEAANLDLSISWHEGMLFAYGPEFDYDRVY
jgi:hypothetical protein